MYYSKNTSPSIPKNYGGNAFRVIDESDRTYRNEDLKAQSLTNEERENLRAETNFESQNLCNETSLISSFLSGISVEDILLLGLIFIIHNENSNDPVLFLLLLLLLSK